MGKKGDVGGFGDGESGRIAVGDGRLGGGGFEALVGWPFLVIFFFFFLLFFFGWNSTGAHVTSTTSGQRWVDISVECGGWVTSGPPLQEN